MTPNGPYNNLEARQVVRTDPGLSRAEQLLKGTAYAPTNLLSGPGGSVVGPKITTTDMSGYKGWASGPVVVNSTPTYDAAAAQRAADYSAANEDVNYAEGRIDPNYQIGYDNLLGQYNSGMAKLTGDKERATRDYKTATTRAQDGRADTVSRINQGISNQFSGVKRLLGSRGAGSSSAAQIAAPYAVGALGNEQRQGVQRTYGMNMQDIDTKRGDYLQDWETKRGETETWKNNQTKALEAKRAEQRVKIAQQRAALNPGNAAQYRSSIRDLMTQIDNLQRTDSYVAPTAAYKAPELTAYGYQPAGGPSATGDTSVAQKLGAYYTLLPEEQKEELL